MAATPQVPQLPAARTGSAAVELDEVKKIQASVSTLTEAIFLPFKGFRPVPLSSEDSLTQGEKLAKIVENVDNQQALVKSNMIYLTEKRASEVAAKAEAELVDMGEGHIDEEPGAAEARRERRKEAEALMQFMRRPARANARKEDFIGRGSATTASRVSHTLENGAPNRKRYANGDVKMGAPQPIPRSRSTYAIRKKATSDLQSIVMDGTTQLEAYHKLSSSTLNHYKQAQSRRTCTINSTYPSPVRARLGNINMSPQRAAIIPGPSPSRKNDKNASPPVFQGLRRTSTGMPIVGSMFTKPVRNLETMEELARRGSK